MVSFIHPDDHRATLQERAGLSLRGKTVGFVNRYATKDGGWPVDRLEYHLRPDEH